MPAVAREYTKAIESSAILKLPMAKYEYIRIELDFGALDELNRLAGIGFHVVAVAEQIGKLFALLERKLPD